MAVSVKSDPALETSAPSALFETPQVGGARNIFHFRQQYDVARDGPFLINVPVADEVSAPITLMLNWFEELKARGPSGPR